MEMIYESTEIDLPLKAGTEELLHLAYQVAVEHIYTALKIGTENMVGSGSARERSIGLGVAAAARAVDKFREYVEKEGMKAEYSQGHGDENGDEIFGTTADD